MGDPFATVAAWGLGVGEGISMMELLFSQIGNKHDQSGELEGNSPGLQTSPKVAVHKPMYPWAVQVVSSCHGIGSSWRMLSHYHRALGIIRREAAEPSASNHRELYLDEALPFRKDKQHSLHLSYYP